MSVRPVAVRAAKVVQVIETVSLVGRGEDESDPCREVTQWWSLDGELLASRDPTRLPLKLLTDPQSADLGVG